MPHIMTTPADPSHMVAVAEFADGSDALSDAALLAAHGIEALVVPDPTAQQSASAPFRLLTAESAVHQALQVLLQQALVNDPATGACPQCGAPAIHYSPGRRLFAVVELALGGQLAPALPACPACGWPRACPSPSMAPR